MKKTVMCVALSGLMMGAAMEASAASLANLSDLWFSTRINTAVKNLHGIDGSVVDPNGVLTTRNYKYDSKKNCNSTIVDAANYDFDVLVDITDGDFTVEPWYEANNAEYALVTFCTIDGTVGPVSAVPLWLMDDGNLSNMPSVLNFEAMSIATFPTGAVDFSQGAEFSGNITFQVKYNNDGSVKSAKVLAPRDGVIDSWDDDISVWGTADNGLNIDLINPAKLPAGFAAAKEALLGAPTEAAK